MNVEPPDPIDYERAVADITRPTVRLASYAQRSRRLIWAMLVAVLAAFAGLGFSIDSMYRINQLAHNARVAQCMTGNNFRAGDQELWARILSYPTPAGTPEQQALQDRSRADLTQFLARHDAPIDCSKVP